MAKFFPKHRATWLQLMRAVEGHAREWDAFVREYVQSARSAPRAALPANAPPDVRSAARRLDQAEDRMSGFALDIVTMHRDTFRRWAAGVLKMSKEVMSLGPEVEEAELIPILRDIGNTLLEWQAKMEATRNGLDDYRRPKPYVPKLSPTRVEISGEGARMDIVGAINHQFQEAGVKVRSRVVGRFVEVQVLVPTRPRGTIYYGRMDLDEFVKQMGIEVVGGKAFHAIKKAAKKVVKNDLVRSVVQNAKTLAKTMVPGAGLALQAASTLTSTAKKLSAKAKAGDDKAAKLLRAPLVVKPLSSPAQAKGPVLATRKPLAAPAGRALARVPPPEPVEAEYEPPDGQEDEPVESGETVETSADDSADEEVERLISSEEPEEVAGAGHYHVTTPAGLRVRVTLP